MEEQLQIFDGVAIRHFAVYVYPNNEQAAIFPDINFINGMNLMLYVVVWIGTY